MRGLWPKSPRTTIATRIRIGRRLQARKAHACFDPCPLIGSASDCVNRRRSSVVAVYPSLGYDFAALPLQWRRFVIRFDSCAARWRDFEDGVRRRVRADCVVAWSSFVNKVSIQDPRGALTAPQPAAAPIAPDRSGVSHSSNGTSRNHASSGVARPRRIAIAVGGTAGHTYPGLALAENYAAASDRVEILIVGRESSLESQAP